MKLRMRLTYPSGNVRVVNVAGDRVLFQPCMTWETESPHAVIERMNGRIVLRDLESKVGTYAAGARIAHAFVQQGLKLLRGSIAVEFLEVDLA